MSIVTPLEYSVPWEKKSFPPHSAVQIFSSSGFEKVSCKLKIVACEQALHLGDIVKSTRTRGTRTGPSRLRRSLACLRAARFAHPNRRACLQAMKIVAFWFFKLEKIALLLFVLRNPLTFKERIFNLCAILFYGGDKKFINMLWLWWLKTGENN